MRLYETLTEQELGGFGPKDVLSSLLWAFALALWACCDSRTQGWFGSPSSAPTCLAAQGSEPAPSQGTVPPLHQKQPQRLGCINKTVVLSVSARGSAAAIKLTKVVLSFPRAPRLLQWHRVGRVRLEALSRQGLNFSSYWGSVVLGQAFSSAHGTDNRAVLQGGPCPCRCRDTLYEHILQSHSCFTPRVHMGAILSQP